MTTLSEAAATLGRSSRKASAARANGKHGGRPKTLSAEDSGLFLCAVCSSLSGCSKPAFVDQLTCMADVTSQPRGAVPQSHTILSTAGKSAILSRTPSPGADGRGA
jgi:hypothetical protein